MFIRRLSLTNFRRFPSLDLEFKERVVYLTGLNEAGKSTILAAIAYALRGTCLWAPKGQGIRALRTVDKTGPLNVMMDTTAGIIERSESGSGVRSQAGAMIEAKLSTDPLTSLVCLQWEQFLDLPEAEKRSLMLASLGVEVTQDAVRDLLEDDEWAAVQHLRFETVESIARAHKHVYDERTFAKKEQASDLGELARLRQELSMLLDDMGMKGQPLTQEQATERLARTNAQIKELQDEVFALAQARVDLEKDRKNLAERITEREESVRQIALRLEGLTCMSEEDLDLLEKAASDSQDQHERGKEETAKLTGQANRMRGHLDMEEQHLQMLQRMEAGGGRCGTCGTKKPATQIVGWIKQATEKVQRETEGFMDLLRQIEELPPLQALGTAAERARADLATATSERKRILKERNDVNAQLSKVQAQAETDRKKLKALGSATDDTLTKRITVLGERVDRGTKIRRMLEDYIKKLGEVGRAETKAAAMTKRRDRLERTVEKFAPGGAVASKLMVEKVKGMQDRLQVPLQPFGRKILLELEPFSILLGRNELPPDRMIRLDLAADSSTIRAGLAFKTALAANGGLKFFVADRIDALDIRGRGGLVKTIGAALEMGVEQVILAGTLKGEEKDFKAPELAGWQFILLPQV